MAEEQQPDMREQLNEMMINARNEAIMQAANLVMLGQKAMHLGLGAAALSKDEAAALLTRMVERGEIAEGDIQKNVNVLVERVRARGEASDAEIQEFAQKATVVLKENVRTILATVPGGQTIEGALQQAMGGKSPAPGDASGDAATDKPEP